METEDGCALVSHGPTAATARQHAPQSFTRATWRLIQAESRYVPNQYLD